ncbi:MULTISPECIES: transcriptional regulator [unclassified Bradyrhizobium]|uniref:transcriptional regulator n=1 Tax=unclassified Bradyrhizobium TaxID=2631580 RepID=UPI0028E8387F|nr:MULTISPECIES: transcriptional regulator [unclassified Bradyrhizobium]
MSGKKPSEPSAQAIARADRQRLAREEGARAMADVEKRAVEIRQNMQRLRALREAKEAEEAQKPDALPKAVKKRRKTRIVT